MSAEHVGAGAFGGFAEAVRNHRGVDAAGTERLGDRGSVAQDAHLEIVLVRIDAEIIQGDHGLQPKTAADALHAEGLAAQFFQRADFFARDQLARNLCHGRGDALEAHAAGRGAERVGRRTVVVLHLAGGECRHAEGAVAQLHHADIEAVFSET